MAVEQNISNEETVLEVDGLYKTYRIGFFRKRVEAVRGISFRVQRGEIFGFIGPNGAGKSTTIRLLLSLIHPSGGGARVFGQDVTKHGPEIRRDIGYLPSEVYYYEGMKVIDLLKYSASFYPGDCTQRIKELSDLMELDMHRRISDLSYGNKKKVGIVQGLLHSPKLLFLDEPTAGLDPIGAAAFDMLTRELTDILGLTVFLITHDLDTLHEICDRVAVIADRTIIAVGTIPELMASDHPWIQEYFNGPRGRAALASQELAKAMDSPEESLD